MWVRKINFGLLILLAPAVFSCQNRLAVQPEESGPAVCEVHLQSEFFEIPVSMPVDDSLVLQDTVSTDQNLSLAAIIPLHVDRGVHLLKVIFDNIVQKTSRCEVTDRLYIGIHYNPDDQTLRFHHQPTPYYYW